MTGILASLALIVLFAAPLEGHEIEGTLQRIEKTGKIRIGFRDSEPPMSFLGKDRTPVGYSIDLCKRIVVGVKNKIGKEVAIEYIPVTAETRFKALVEDKIDILCGSTTKTLSRAEIVDFTQLTFVTGASLMTMKDKQIRGLSDLNGKKIGVVRDTTTAKVLKDMLRETLTDAEVVTLNSAVEGLDGLQKGKIAAFSSDQVVLIGLIISSGSLDKFAVASQVFSFEPFALAVRRNDADFRLVADRVISHLYRSGLILQIYDRWLGGFSKKRPPVFDALYQLNATPE